MSLVALLPARCNYSDLPPEIALLALPLLGASGVDISRNNILMSWNAVSYFFASSNNMICLGIQNMLLQRSIKHTITLLAAAVVVLLKVVMIGACSRFRHA